MISLLLLQSIGTMPALMAGPLADPIPSDPVPVEAPTTEAGSESARITSAPGMASSLSFWSSAEDDGPWRLDDALGTPDWLTIDGHQRTRYESHDGRFQLNGREHGHIFALRTSLRARAVHNAWTGTVEILDSRQLDAPDDAVLNTTTVNALELQQISVAHTSKGVIHPDDELTFTVGRRTLDLGSRRFVARNRFRNTINAFTGVHGLWDTGSGETWEAFWFMPVQRLPRQASLVHDNEQAADDEFEEVQLVGLFGSIDDVVGESDLEVFLFGLDEADAPDLATRNRKLWTLGSRLNREPAVGKYHSTIEAAVQFGESRSSTNPANTTDLDHLAGFLHMSVGRRFEGESRPTVTLLFDYASGDSDPTDGDNNRFDTLYGARRFEFGPTGIFGAFARSNLVTPGVRFSVDPTSDTNLMLAYRVYRLASDKDAWTTSGLSDPSGAAGSSLGSMAEFRLRWDIAPKNLRLECGVAYFAAGSFVDRAPNATDQGDTVYGYVGTTFSS